MFCSDCDLRHSMSTVSLTFPASTNSECRLAGRRLFTRMSDCANSVSISSSQAILSRLRRRPCSYKGRTDFGVLFREPGKQMGSVSLGSREALPLHRLSLLHNIRVIDAECMSFSSYDRCLRTPASVEGPLVLDTTNRHRSQRGTGVHGARISNVGHNLSRVTLHHSPPTKEKGKQTDFSFPKSLTAGWTVLSRIHVEDPFPPVHQHLLFAREKETRWRAYASLFPHPISTRGERVRALFLQFFLNGWFLYIPPVLYIIYRRYCITKRHRLVFLAIVLFLVLCPIPRYLPIRRWKMWRLLHRYHRATVIVEDAKSLPPSKPTIFTAVPHAIVPVAQALLPTGEFGSLLGHITMAVASIVKYVPVYGHIIRLIGSQDVSAAKLMTTLTRDRQSVVISPGGIAEMYTVDEKTENLLLKDRQGLLRLALQTGSDVVPVYCFGNSETFKLVKASTKLQPLARFFRVALLLFFGRFGLPIPFEVPLLYVIGRGLRLPKVEDPTQEDVQIAHRRYMSEIRRIFNTYKGLYGWKEKELIVH
ncbi:UNVERIFIED_CONTAM: diacylglycerol acyltransferase [Hammondia hammondi]|eukprot:XP_008888332.1 diacylglycerol acyltransferase [Hammondia hammondi]